MGGLEQSFSEKMAHRSDGIMLMMTCCNSPESPLTFGNNTAMSVFNEILFKIKIFPSITSTVSLPIYDNFVIK
jgi:hypothetical protein